MYSFYSHMAFKLHNIVLQPLAGSSLLNVFLLPASWFYSRKTQNAKLLPQKITLMQ